MRKQDDALFLAQAVPWMILFLLWIVVSFVVLIPTSALRLVGWLCRLVASSVEQLLGFALFLLFTLRPTRQGGPQDPTATAPVTERQS